MGFEQFNLDPRILKAIEDAGFSIPTPIQEKAIPEVFNKRDLLASAQTGTGKTAAFLIPALQKLITSSPVKGIGPRILILAPTRELAMQIATQSATLSKNLPRVKTVCIFGGAPYPIQRRQLSKPFEILVATPGRLIDHLSQGLIDFARIETLILDEADRMLDMGFLPAVEKIVASLPKKRQTLLFSATLKGPILQFAKSLMNDPIEVSTVPKDEKIDHIKQHVYFVDHLSHKLDLLKHLLSDNQINQALIFTSTKRYTEELTKELRESGLYTLAIHGDMDQRKRKKTLDLLRSGECRFLVATDVVARGIDLSTITHVFNFDLPRCVEDYIHRIGRTGRAGAKGIASSFAGPQDRILMKRIESSTKQKMIPQVVPGLEPTKKNLPPKEKPEANKKPRFYERNKKQREGGPGLRFRKKTSFRSSKFD